MVKKVIVLALALTPLHLAAVDDQELPPVASSSSAPSDILPVLADSQPVRPDSQDDLSSLADDVVNDTSVHSSDSDNEGNSASKRINTIRLEGAADFLPDSPATKSLFSFGHRTKKRAMIGVLVVAAVAVAMYGKQVASRIYRWVAGAEDDVEIAPEDLANIFKDLENGEVVIVGCDGCSCDNCTCKDCQCREKNACLQETIALVVQELSSVTEKLVENIKNIDQKTAEAIVDQLAQTVDDIKNDETIDLSPEQRELLSAAQAVVEEVQKGIEESLKDAQAEQASTDVQEHVVAPEAL